MRDKVYYLHRTKAVSLVLAEARGVTALIDTQRIHVYWHPL